MPFADSFHRTTDRWRAAGSPRHEHRLAPWYDDPGMPREGYGCTVCGEGFEDHEVDAFGELKSKGTPDSNGGASPHNRRSPR